MTFEAPNLKQGNLLHRDEVVKSEEARPKTPPKRGSTNHILLHVIAAIGGFHRSQVTDLKKIDYAMKQNHH
jgi:hypothetical protein